MELTLKTTDLLHHSVFLPNRRLYNQDLDRAAIPSHLSERGFQAIQLRWLDNHWRTSCVLSGLLCRLYYGMSAYQLFLESMGRRTRGILR